MRVAVRFVSSLPFGSTKEMEAVIMIIKLFIQFLFISLATTSSIASPLIDQAIRLNTKSDERTVMSSKVECLSWRLAVETRNLRDWLVVPPECKKYVAKYMTGGQHDKDCRVVTEAAWEYAQTLNLTGDGKDIWVFDIDQTALSMLPYYARDDVQYGAIEFNVTRFKDWLLEGSAPPIPSVLELYKKLVSIGIKIVFISGTPENQRHVRVSNFINTGYFTWEKIMLSIDGESNRFPTSEAYKSTKRRVLVEEEGYRIVGNIGDQWGDISGDYVGDRTFKLPNPMFAFD